MSLPRGEQRDVITRALDVLAAKRVVERIWSRDHTVWKPSPEGIADRLGWLDIAGRIRESLPRLASLADSARAEGFRQALLLGMGGSSLAPDVFRRTFGVAPDFLDLAVLDSTDPAAVLACDEKIDPARTLFIVSTKSGGTVETLSFFSYFYNRAAASIGVDGAGGHFIAVTDPGSPLEETAGRYGFRETFLNDPAIGGRFSALSLFGLVPAALIGADTGLLCRRALSMAELCAPSRPLAENPGAVLGAVMAAEAAAGRNKLTFIISAGVEGFGDWVEQLIAESTGKEGRGILPVVGEQPADPSYYGDDRLFVDLRLRGDDSAGGTARALEQAGHPLVRLSLRDPYDLGSQMFLWEMATAVAGALMGINPFDQPNVEAAKVQARGVVSEYRKTGTLPAEKPLLTSDGCSVFISPGALPADGIRPSSPGDLLREFLDLARPGDYVALQAYLPPTTGIRAALERLRARIRRRTRLATTLGFGPRYLHSTGQLHKGDAGKGLFLQFTAAPSRDVPIPDAPGSPESHVTFGILEAAQAIGDREALAGRGRRVMRIHAEADAAGIIEGLADSLRS